MPDGASALGKGVFFVAGENCKWLVYSNLGLATPQNAVLLKIPIAICTAIGMNSFIFWRMSLLDSFSNAFFYLLSSILSSIDFNT